MLRSKSTNLRLGIQIHMWTVIVCVKEMLDKSKRKNEQLHKQLFNLERFKNDYSSIAFLHWISKL